MNTPITLTEGAIEELSRLIKKEEKPYLRIGVKGGGCAGFSYILEFDEASSKDELYEFDGLPVAVDKTHLIYLHGIEIDYESGLNARGFVFNNPNAETTCGCGTSFSA